MFLMSLAIEQDQESSRRLFISKQNTTKKKKENKKQPNKKTPHRITPLVKEHEKPVSALNATKASPIMTVETFIPTLVPFLSK